MSIEKQIRSDGNLTRNEQRNFISYINSEVLKDGKVDISEFTKGEVRQFISQEWAEKNTIHLGSVGIRGLQKALIKHKYLPKGSDDAVFGVNTLAALIRFQHDKKLGDIDGIAGPDTQKALGLTQTQEEAAGDDSAHDVPKKPTRKGTKVAVDDSGERSCGLLSLNCKSFISRLPATWKGIGETFAKLMEKKGLDITGTPTVQLFDPARKRGLIVINGHIKEIPIIYNSGETPRNRLHPVTEMNIASKPSVDCSLTGSATVMGASFRGPTMGSKYIHGVDLRGKYNDDGKQRNNTEGCIGWDADQIYDIATLLRSHATPVRTEKRSGKKNKYGFETQGGKVTFYELQKPFYTYVA